MLNCEDGFSCRKDSSRSPPRSPRSTLGARVFFLSLLCGERKFSPFHVHPSDLFGPEPYLIGLSHVALNESTLAAPELFAQRNSILYQYEYRIFEYSVDWVRRRAQ